MRAIIDELVRATRQPERGTTEPEQRFLMRLTRAASRLSDDAWLALSDASREWATEAIISVNARTAIKVPYDPATTFGESV